MRIGASVSAVAIGASLVAATRLSNEAESSANVAATTFKRVDVSIGAMSRCPDALFFENAFSRTLERVNKKIKLSLNFIATEDDSAAFGAVCKHGKEECQGNIHQLCIIDALNPDKAGRRYDLSPSDAQRLWWDFVQCENYVGGLKRIGEEALAKQCVDAIGEVPHWEKDGIKECIQGSKGVALLKKSIKEVERRHITNSATLQIEGKTVCVRDDNQWKNCSEGHETSDWVRLIEDAYRRKNPTLYVEEQESPLFTLQHQLNKRQQGGAPPNGTTTSPPPSGSPNNDNNGQQGAPLSVFAFLRRLPFSPSSAALPRVISHARMQQVNLYAPASQPSAYDDQGSFLLQPRQFGGGGGNGTNANNTLLSAFPTPYLAFGIIAIALFVLVVSFVLLRIFVRNRRLRRLGIYPEGPIDRLLGGAVREYEDTLPPPRLWEAKIADVRSGNQGADARAEKSALGGGVGAGDVKQHGWDALMPVSAALPPNLYPVIYEGSGLSSTPSDAPPTYPPPPHHQSTRIGRHMPQFLRRHTGDDAGEVVSSNAAAAGAGTDSSLVSASNHGGDRGDEKLAASINVTVLIAMPSPRTIFPSSRRLGSMQSNSSSHRNAARQGSALSAVKLDEVEEDDHDGGSSPKGKARRAPSLRSVKSSTSVKSVAEARRDAFFAQINPNANPTSEAPPYREEEGEDEELPELMFGTASVPIFARSRDSTPPARQPTASAMMSNLTQPTRSNILALVSSAAQARERKSQAEKAAAEKMRKQDEVELEGNRRSVAETSIDGEANGAVLGSSAHDPSASEGPQAPMGDVAARMMRSHDVDHEYEMNDMGPSRSGAQPRRSVDVSTPNTLEPFLFRAAPTGMAAMPGQEEGGASNLSLNMPQSPSAYTANEGSLTPTFSAPLTASDSRRYSLASWHTGNHDDAHAARALAEQEVSIAPTQRPA